MMEWSRYFLAPVRDDSFSSASDSLSAAGDPGVRPAADEDIFADERRRLEAQAYHLFDDAALLRRHLRSLTDRQQRLMATGAPPAFDVNDATLAWLAALPDAIFRATPVAGTALEQAVSRVGTRFGAQAVSVGAGMCDVLMRLRTDFEPRQLRALGLLPGGVLTLTAHFEPTYHRAPEPPELTIEYSAPNVPPRVATSAVSDAKHHFRLGYQMLNILTRHLREAWTAGASEHVLVNLFSLADKRLRNLGHHCVVCDETLAAPQLRPITCGATACVSQAETWGYGFEPQEIVQNPEVADLLISMTAAAAQAGREAFFKRLPSGFRQAKGIDFKAMFAEINRLPAVQTLVTSPDMITTLEHVSPLAVPTLSWLMVSNEGYLEYIPKHQQCPEITTEFQFRIFGGPVEREVAFQARPGQQLNRFAFHGSPFGNWHSILRTGLTVGRNDTGLGFNGAAYGSGIYVSNNIGTSLGYSANGSGWINSALGASPTCVALCETNGASRRTRPSQAIDDVDVFATADAVALRYLFVYPASSTGAQRAVSAARLGAYLREHANDADNSVYLKRPTAGWQLGSRV